jgi:hypothetical protein
MTARAPAFDSAASASVTVLDVLASDAANLSPASRAIAASRRACGGASRWSG